jgi:hypothetical protein
MVSYVMRLFEASAPDALMLALLLFALFLALLPGRAAHGPADSLHDGTRPHREAVALSAASGKLADGTAVWRLHTLLSCFETAH